MSINISLETTKKMESFQQTLAGLQELLDFPVNWDDPTDHDATLLGNQLAVDMICAKFTRGDESLEQTTKKLESYLRSLKIYLENS